MALTGLTLIDGSGSSPVAGANVLISDGEIIAAGPGSSVPVPPGARQTNLAGKYVVPGLIDLHVHLGTTGGPGFRAADYTRERVLHNLNSYLYFGVTSVRSIGTERQAGLEIRDEQRSQPVTTARLFTAGRGFTAPGGHPSQEIGDIARQPKTPAEAAADVAELSRQKVDAIKIWVDKIGGRAPQISRPIIEEILKQAATSNIPVTAHIHSLEDTLHLMKHGAAGFLHMIRDTEKIPDTLLAEARDKRIPFTPTLIRQELAWYFKERAERLDDSDVGRLVDPVTHTAMREAVANSKPSAAAREQFDIAMRNTAKFAAAGVPIGVGSDGGSQMDLPGLMTHRECELLAEAGMKPLEVIRAATSNGALALRRPELGVIAAGKRADLVVLDADPVANVSNLRRIHRVMLDGNWVNRDTLALR